MDAERLRDKSLTLTDLLAECENSSLLKTSISIALLVHADQKRSNGQPYMTHIESVFHAVQKQMAKSSEPGRFIKVEDAEVCLALALLHDVIENGKAAGFDGDYLSKTLSKAEPARLPLVGKLVDLVLTLTRRENEPYLEYILRVKKNSLASFVKMCDIGHNLSDHPNGSRRDKYELANHILMASEQASY